MQKLKPHLSGVPIGLISRAGSFPYPQILDKGRRVIIMTNALAHYDTIVEAVKSFITQEAPV